MGWFAGGSADSIQPAAEEEEEEVGGETMPSAPGSLCSASSPLHRGEERREDEASGCQ